MINDTTAKAIESHITTVIMRLKPSPHSPKASITKVMTIMMQEIYINTGPVISSFNFSSVVSNAFVDSEAGTFIVPNTKLPERPDYEKADAFLRNARRRALSDELP